MNIKQDKLLHFTVSAFLAVVFGLFLPWWAAGLIALGIGVGKELWDKEHGGVPSWADFGADALGVLCGTIMLILKLIMT